MKMESSKGVESLVQQMTPTMMEDVLLGMFADWHDDGLATNWEEMNSTERMTIFTLFVTRDMEPESQVVRILISELSANTGIDNLIKRLLN